MEKAFCGTIFSHYLLALTRYLLFLFSLIHTGNLWIDWNLSFSSFHHDIFYFYFTSCSAIQSVLTPLLLCFISALPLYRVFFFPRSVYVSCFILSSLLFSLFFSVWLYFIPHLLSNVWMYVRIFPFIKCFFIILYHFFSTFSWHYYNVLKVLQQSWHSNLADLYAVPTW